MTKIALFTALACSLFLNIAEAQDKYPLPAAVCGTLNVLRRELPTPLTDKAAIGALLNRVAFTHRAAGFGLSRKTGGNRCPSPVGEIACDVLMLPDGRYWDVLTDAGNKTGVRCGVPEGTGFITDPRRGHVPPVEPGGDGPPVIVAPPTVDCPEKAQLQQAHETIAAQQTRINEISDNLVDMTVERDRVYTQLQEWDARLKDALAANADLQRRLDGVSCRGVNVLGLFRTPCTVVK